MKSIINHESKRYLQTSRIQAIRAAREICLLWTTATGMSEAIHMDQGRRESFKEKGALLAEENNTGGARLSGSTGDQEREPGDEIEDQYQDFINPHEKVYHCVK